MHIFVLKLTTKAEVALPYWGRAIDEETAIHINRQHLVDFAVEVR